VNPWQRKGRKRNPARFIEIHRRSHQSQTTLLKKILPLTVMAWRRKISPKPAKMDTHKTHMIRHEPALRPRERPALHEPSGFVVVLYRFFSLALYN